MEKTIKDFCLGKEVPVTLHYSNGEVIDGTVVTLKPAKLGGIAEVKGLCLCKAARQLAENTKLKSVLTVAGGRDVLKWIKLSFNPGSI